MCQTKNEIENSKNFRELLQQNKDCYPFGKVNNNTI